LAADRKASREALGKAVYALKKCEIRYGKYIFITGSDDVSILIGAVAKQVGAIPIFNVEDAAQKRYVESMGFEVFLRPSQDLKEMLNKFTSGRRFDIVFETTGAAAMYELLIQLLKRGAYAALMKPLSEPFCFHVCDVVRDQIHFLGITRSDDESGKIAGRLIESGTLDGILTKLAHAA
jgi:(R,R)-butanediol dehydrogenase/meso-butanediol dehydrogenase/diacetyl reductase